MEIDGISRRVFLRGACILGSANLIGIPRLAAAEPRPEVRAIRLLRGPAMCMAPQQVAQELLYAEGFESVDYVEQESFREGVRGAAAIAQGMADITQWDAFATLKVLDSSKDVVVLAGIHAGCWELFVNHRIATLRDLKGKTVAIRDYANGDHVLLSSMLAYVGMDPRTSVNWITGNMVTDAASLFVNGHADAFMAFAPQPQELRAARIGRVLIDTGHDKPWSQYFCCLVVARREFVEKCPVAAKRALRAILKATDICSRNPAQAVEALMARGLIARRDLAEEVIRNLPYDRWRENDPEDTLRFYALRLHEVGMLSTTPQKLVSEGTNSRFLRELRRELRS